MSVPYYSSEKEVCDHESVWPYVVSRDNRRQATICKRVSETFRLHACWFVDGYLWYWIYIFWRTSVSLQQLLFFYALKGLHLQYAELKTKIYLSCLHLWVIRWKSNKAKLVPLLSSLSTYKCYYDYKAKATHLFCSIIPEAGQRRSCPKRPSGWAFATWPQRVTV